MKSLLRIIVMIISLQLFPLVNAFADNTENKEKILNSTKNVKRTYLDNITKSADNILEIYNKISDKKETRDIYDTTEEEEFLSQYKNTDKLIDEKTLIDYGIIEERSSYGEKITKGEFIKSLLKVMGVTDELALYVKIGVNLEVDRSKDPFLGLTRYYEEEKDLYGYLEIMEYYQIVTIGDFKDINSYLTDGIKMEECLHIMNKCLKRKEEEKKLGTKRNIMSECTISENVISEAEQNSLVKSTDERLNKTGKILNYEDFCTLLCRMLDHRMGYYFKYVDFEEYHSQWIYAFYDKTDSDKIEIRYIDHLNFIKNQNFPLCKPGGLYVPDTHK